MQDAKSATDTKAHLGQDERLEHSTETAGVVCTAEDDRRIRNRTDRFLLPVLMWVYFLQIADKTIIGLTAVYGLRTDANLSGYQYSTIGAIGYYAQLGAQPLAAWALVKVRYSWCECGIARREAIEGADW